MDQRQPIGGSGLDDEPREASSSGVLVSSMTVSMMSFAKRLRRHPTAVLGLGIFCFFIICAAFAPILAPHDPNRGSPLDRLQPPCWKAGGSSKFILGTDHLGRDILSRMIYGSRISVTIGVSVVGLSIAIGVFLGAVCGYYRGRFDEVVSRLAEILLAFPNLVFLILIMSVVGPGLHTLLFALTLTRWVGFFRVMRGQMLSARNSDYVQAARAIGRDDYGIIFRHLVPNLIYSVLVMGTFQIASTVIAEASLSFLGLGVPPGITAWGSMVASGRNYVATAWWVATLPGIALLVFVIGVNMFGEGLRDLLDPRLRGTERF